MPLEFLMFWMRETLANIRRNALMSLLAVSSVTVALFILGGFYLALSNGRALVKDQVQNLDMAVLISHNVTPARRKQIYAAVHIPQVRELKFVSKAQVLEQMSADPSLKNIPVDDFRGDTNPFSDELRVRLKNPEDTTKVHDYFLTIKDVSGIRFSGPETQSLLDFNRLLAISGAVALCILGLGALLIVHNTIRLTIFARRREMRIMELVGATSTFIRTPFVLEGMIYGLSGAIIAAGLLSTLYGTLAARSAPLLQTLLPLTPGELLPSCWSAMILSGLGFGIVGAWLSLSRARLQSV